MNSKPECSEPSFKYQLHPASIAAWKKMTAAEKYELFKSHMRHLRRIKRDAFRMQHPDWTEEQLDHATNRAFLLART